MLGRVQVALEVVQGDAKGGFEAPAFPGAAGAFPGRPSRPIRPAESQGLHRSGRSGERWCAERILYNDYNLLRIYNCTWYCNLPQQKNVFFFFILIFLQYITLHIEEPCVGECAAGTRAAAASS